MNKSQMQIIDHIRQQLVTNILAGPKPPPDEMPLLSQEYQDVWRAEDEEPGDVLLATVLDEPGQWFTKPATLAEHAFDQRTEQLLRKKRWVESEQLTSLARIEKLLAHNEPWRQRLGKHKRELSQQIERCRAESEKASTPAQAAAAQRRIRQCQRVMQANLSELAERDRMQEKALSATRRNAIEYLGMVKTLEARKDYRKLLCKRKRAARGGLGLLGTLGVILAINDLQKMAHGIDKLAKKK